MSRLNDINRVSRSSFFSTFVADRCGLAVADLPAPVFERDRGHLSSTTRSGGKTEGRGK